MKATTQLNEAAIRAHCENRLDAFKIPKEIHFLEELPKGPSGKIQRNKILDSIKKK